jgi:hypothetical protein
MISPRSTKKSLKTSNVTELRRARAIELLRQKAMPSARRKGHYDERYPYAGHRLLHGCHGVPRWPDDGSVLTLQTGDLTFEFAINEDGAKAMAGNLQQFLDMVQSRGARAN